MADEKHTEKEDPYDKEGRKEQLEDGEIDGAEEGFMRGYDEAAEEKKKTREEE